MMPELLAFKKGSRIELASGDKVSVEEMAEEDFVQCAERDGGVKILRCTLVAIEGVELMGSGHASTCKLILRVNSKDNKQVICNLCYVFQYFLGFSLTFCRKHIIYIPFIQASKHHLRFRMKLQQ
jgi:hypothetical protein